VENGLKNYFEYNILLDPDEINYRLYEIVRNKGRRDNHPQTEIVEEESPVKRMKTVKNEREIAGFRSAMLKDGIAMVKFLKWISECSDYSEYSEISISDKLESLRAEQPLFRGISFDTIAGYGAHGAIVHYEATPETDIPLEPKGLLLLDSGAQYLDGTTDITRTIALGPLTEEEKRVYTLVLKGHIQIELCKFPSGTSGTQIDILARQAMWREGLNYLHGTGHGVGTYLNVHEGPHQFRMEWKPAPLVEGMTITDEPGIYLAGKFGVRIENTLLIVPYKETEFGKFLQFESLTLCPIDKAPILIDMLLPEEIDWLNDYHQRVFDTLSSHLSEKETAWLCDACAPLSVQ
jgi:Xaa-Pro aminopeptidase